jgi:hypothetical protein
MCTVVTPPKQATRSWPVGCALFPGRRRTAPPLPLAPLAWSRASIRIHAALAGRGSSAAVAGYFIVGFRRRGIRRGDPGEGCAAAAETICR